MESKSKFHTEHKKYDAIIKGISGIILFVAATSTAYILLKEQSEIDHITLSIFIPGIVVFNLIIYGTLKNQVKLEIDGGFITIIHRLTGTTKTFELRQIEGFKTREFNSKTGLVKELILIKDGKPFQIISSANTINLDTLIERFNNSLEFLGEEKYGLWQQLISIFRGI